MKYLKFALVAALSTLICLSFAPQYTAKGETSFRYAYAADYDDDGSPVPYFCKNSTRDSALFAIPATYCVEILGEEGDWYRCRYAKDEGAYKAQYGYCLKEYLTPIEEPFENEYLNYSFTVEFTAPATQIDTFKVQLTVAFYGNASLNSYGMSYVGYGDKFGYIPETKTAYPKNNLPQPTVSTDVEQPENPVNVTLITAAVITAVAVVAVAVLYFAGKRPKITNNSSDLR